MKIDMKNTWKKFRNSNYEVNIEGQVRRIGIDGKLLTPTPNVQGRLKYNLTIDNELKTYQAHALVAEVFIGERPKGYDICHNDSDYLNNHVSNLRYDTREQNLLDEIRNDKSHSGAIAPSPTGIYFTNWCYIDQLVKENKLKEQKLIHYIKRLYKLGMTTRDIAHTYKTNSNKVKEILKSNGVELREGQERRPIINLITGKIYNNNEVAANDNGITRQAIHTDLNKGSGNWLYVRK